MDKLYFDHCYTGDQKHRFHKKLERLGFTLRETEVQHPGGHFCRFIMFKTRLGRGSQYLEFIHSSKKPMSSPGISFGYAGPLAKYHKLIKKRMKASLTHRNYEWKSGSRKRLPGWNFLNFDKRGFSGFYPWLTEYEPRDGVKPKPVKPHRNGAQKIVALEFEVNTAAAKFFRKLSKSEGDCRLACGTQIYLQPGRRARMTAIVIKMKNVERFAKRYKIPREFYRNKHAARIKNPSGMWDVILI